MRKSKIKAQWTLIGKFDWHDISLGNNNSLEAAERLVVETMNEMEQHSLTGKPRYLFRVQSPGRVFYVWKKQPFLSRDLGEPWKPAETDLQAERMEHLKRRER